MRGCAGSPQRHQREVAVLKGMFPKTKFRAPKDEQPGYLQGSPRQAALLKAQSPAGGDDPARLF
jgi:hypothetical protein